MSKLNRRTCTECGALLSPAFVAENLAEGIQRERMLPLVCAECKHEEITDASADRPTRMNRLYAMTQSIKDNSDEITAGLSNLAHAFTVENESIRAELAVAKKLIEKMEGEMGELRHIIINVAPIGVAGARTPTLDETA